MIIAILTSLCVRGGKRRAYVFENLYFHGGGVLLEGNGRKLSEVTGCRFGGEVGSGADGPPEFAIRLGPGNPISGTMSGFLISRNRFLGKRDQQGPTKQSAGGAIHITKHVKECVVIGNHFLQYFGPLIQEDAPLDPHGSARGFGNPRENYFVANAIDTGKGNTGEPEKPFPRVFSGAAHGWMLVQQPLPE